MNTNVHLLIQIVDLISDNKIYYLKKNLKGLEDSDSQVFCIKGFYEHTL